jgi:hypothetical protein
VLPPVSGPADVLKLVLQPREPSRAAAALVFFVVCHVADASHEGQSASIWRPRRLLYILLQAREPARLAAVHGHHVELRALVVAVRDEREPPAVR